MSYAQISDLVALGLPATSLANVPSMTQQAELDAASGIMDSYFNGRFRLPLLVWDQSVVQACAVIAAFSILCVRGYNPASGADVNIKGRYDRVILWLEQVQRQAVHPVVTQSADPTNSTVQPFVSSNSVLFITTGQTGPSRGW